MNKDVAALLKDQFNQLMVHYKNHYDGSLQNPTTMKITPVEQQLLGLLEWEPSIGIKEVVHNLGLPNSTVTSAVGRLMDKRLVIKEVDATDRRAYRLKLTQNGNDIIAYKRYLKQRFAEEILDGIGTDDEGQKFVELLTRAVRSLDKIHDDPTRSDFMNSLQQEYHGFGPWLIEIKSEKDIPQQYMTHTDKILAADYKFKVPVKQDRHRLRPGMLMYNTVICIYQDHILMIKVSEDSLIDYEIPMDSIMHISSSRELLDSHIILGTNQKTFDIDYNSVSNEISSHVIQLLRERSMVTRGDVNGEIYLADTEVPVDVYRTMTNMIRDEKGLIVVGYQPRVRVTRHFTSTTETIMNSHRKYDLQDALFLSNGKELIAVDSVHEVRTLDEPDYSYRYTFIRLDGITHIDFEDEPLLEGVQNLILKVGDSSVGFKVGEDFDSTYLKRYLKL